MIERAATLEPNTDASDTASAVNAGWALARLRRDPSSGSLATCYAHQVPPRAPKRAFAALTRKLTTLVERVRARPRAEPPPMASTDGPLDAVNEAFHNAYDEARHAAKREGPVFIVLADELVVFHRGERRVLSFSPRAFHVLKSVAHAPVALYAAFEKAEPPSSDDLTGMRARIASAYEKLPENTGDLSESASEDVAFVLRSSLEVIDRVLRDGPVRAHLASFAARVGEALLRLAQEATRIQLKALHEHTEEAMSALSQEERAELQVVVTGNHQARERALAMQYFQKRFAESSGPEDQVSYAEGASDEREALELVGTQRLDRALARAFFGDEKRLQRDILGDAAEQQLGTLSFP